MGCFCLPVNRGPILTFAVNSRMLHMIVHFSLSGILGVGRYVGSLLGLGTRNYYPRHRFAIGFMIDRVHCCGPIISYK